jgi:hypothetical protein
MEPDAKSPEQVLDQFLAEARMGATNEWLAQKTGVSLRFIEHWRRRRDLPLNQPETLSALIGLIAAYDPQQHRTSTDLDWETPAFLLRQPIQYTMFAKTVFDLTTLTELGPELLSQALGVRTKDIEHAVMLWRRHLSQSGRKCLGCDALVDPRFGAFCSRSCHDSIR